MSITELHARYQILREVGPANINSKMPTTGAAGFWKGLSDFQASVQEANAPATQRRALVIIEELQCYLHSKATEVAGCNLAECTPMHVQAFFLLNIG